jgi:hypothetical protein
MPERKISTQLFDIVQTVHRGGKLDHMMYQIRDSCNIIQTRCQTSYLPTFLTAARSILLCADSQTILCFLDLSEPQTDKRGTRRTTLRLAHNVRRLFLPVVVLNFTVKNYVLEHSCFNFMC